MTQRRAFRQAVGIAGGMTAMAKVCGVTRQSLYNWQRRGRIPAEIAVKIERATGITRQTLRPDLFCI